VAGRIRLTEKPNDLIEPVIFHLERMERTSLTKAVLKYSVTGRKDLGRRRKK
jgi:hypothetical protein